MEQITPVTFYGIFTDEKRSSDFQRGSFLSNEL